MKLLVALTRPLRWRTPEHSARQLLAFARAERSSFYDMLAAAQASASSARRALYLAHATDEARHARMFTRRADELCPALARDPRLTQADCEGLFARLGEARFVAFVHHGERRGLARLSSFRDEHARRGDERTRALLDAVLADEARHVAYTEALLADFPEGASINRARLWELGRSWRRLAARISGALFAVSMSTLYLTLFPLAWLLRRRPNEDTWPRS